jgi:S1-C subfamily serine protease
MNRRIRAALIAVLAVAFAVGQYAQVRNNERLWGMLDTVSWHANRTAQVNRNIAADLSERLAALEQPDFSAILRVRDNTVTVLIGASGHGSGVVFVCGYVLTAKHCTEHMQDMKIKTPSGEIFEVEGVWQSPIYDIAILKVPGIVGGIELSHSDSIRLFDEVAIIGTPWETDLSGSITFGRLTFIGRDWYVWIEAFQVSADASPGNSGGPVVTLDGRLIGLLVGGPDPGSSVSICEPIEHIIASIRDCDLYD